MEYKLIKTDYITSITGDAHVLGELIDIFKKEMIKISNDMSIALAKNDYRSIGLLAHKAKGSVAVMGMDDSISLLRHIETCSDESKDVELLESDIYRFKKNISEAISELDDFINNKTY